MYLGLREEFLYNHCAHCGAMQLLNIPHNLAAYYPPDRYYSFNSHVKSKVKTDLLRKWKAEYLLFGKNKVAGRLLSVGYKVPEHFDWFRNAHVSFDDAILDVGCGNGGLLHTMARMGFTNLKGIDPFNEKDYDYGKFKIEKKDIYQIEGSFDFIMLNHVFEHLDEPHKVLSRLYQLLKPGSYLLIRTPVMGNYAWHTYKEDWMALDAPRHLIVHTEKSMKILADQAGFQLKKIVYDGNEFSLVGSEQYKRDIPLTDKRSYLMDKNHSLFSKEEIEKLKAKAQKTNEENQGDQAAFYLFKPDR